MSDKMREEFERWYAGYCAPVEAAVLFHRDPDDPEQYEYVATSDAWAAWQHQQAVIDAKNEFLAEQEMTISNYMDINEAAGKENDALKEEIAELRVLLGRAYGKLIRYGVENTDPLLMDEIKLELMK